MIDQKGREETALSRFQVITPVLWSMEENADPAKVTKVKKEVMEKNGISRKTLTRWIKAYKDGGFDGLKPAEKVYAGPKAIPERLIEEAILLRREVPGRSIKRIIEILELEGKAPPGMLKRTTLQDKLMEKGYSTRQVKLYQQTGGIATRRYARKERGDLWASDIKYGPRLRINGVKRQIYLVCIQDDATRYVIHAGFYDSMEQAVVEDCFHKAVLKEGVPKRILFDNGKQYRTKWMYRACAMLGVKLLYAPPRAPEWKGKQERFNRTVDAFLEEAALMDITTLEEYNRYFQIWLSESYHNREHSALNTTPAIAYKTSKAALRFPPPDTIALAFLHSEDRRVDKSGCISFQNKKYEVGVTYMGQKVTIIYDPANTEKIMVEHPPSGASFEAGPLVIGEHTRPKPEAPEFLTAAKPSVSRLLAAQANRADKRQDEVYRAIRYSGFVARHERHGGTDEANGNSDKPHGGNGHD